MKHETISRKHVAALAGVSETTVSVVLGGNRTIVIAPETRERVIRAAEALGYHPHYAARAMASRRAFALGVLSPWNADVWFFAEMLGGIRRVASDRGYGIVLCNVLGQTGGPEDCVRYFREGRIDGALYLPPPELRIPWLEELREESIPVVLCNGIDPKGGIDSVFIDYAHGIREAVKRLVSDGASSMLYVLPDDESRLCLGDRERVRGFDEAVAGLPAGSAEKVVFRSDGGAEGKLARAKEIVRSLNKPAGIVSCYWIYAYYLRIAAMELGLGEGDVSIVSGDCPAFTRDLYPAVAGIGLPFEEVGRRSAELLIDRLEEKLMGPERITVKEFNFIGLPIE